MSWQGERVRACIAKPFRSIAFDKLNGTSWSLEVVDHDLTQLSRKYHFRKQTMLYLKILIKWVLGVRSGEGRVQPAGKCEQKTTTRQQTPADPCLGTKGCIRFCTVNCWFYTPNNTLVLLQSVKTKWLRPNNSELCKMLVLQLCAWTLSSFSYGSSWIWQVGSLRLPHSLHDTWIHIDFLTWRQ